MNKKKENTVQGRSGVGARFGTASLDMLRRAISARRLSAPMLAGALGASRRVWACGLDFGRTFDNFNMAKLIGAFLATVSFVAIITSLAWLVVRVFLKGTPRVAIAFVPALAVSVLLVVIEAYAIPHFKSVFESIDANLPPQTRVLLSMRYALLLPLLGIGYKVAVQSLKDADVGFYWRYLMAEALFLSLVLWALYSPIFKMC